MGYIKIRKGKAEALTGQRQGVGSAKPVFATMSDTGFFVDKANVLNLGSRHRAFPLFGVTGIPTWSGSDSRGREYRSDIVFTIPESHTKNSQDLRTISGTPRGNSIKRF